MGEKSTFLGALVESRRIVREAAARAKGAMDPGLKAVRETAGKIREQISHLHPPRVDRAARTVERDHCVYEVREADRGDGQDGAYTVARRTGNNGTEVIGSFHVREGTMIVHCGNHSMSELALIAAAWLEAPSNSSSS
jgi:hypothetical protein